MDRQKDGQTVFLPILQGLPEWSEGLLEGPRGLPEGPEGLLEGSEGLPERPEGLPEGPEGLPGQSQPQMDLQACQSSVWAYQCGLRAC